MMPKRNKIQGTQNKVEMRSRILNLTPYNIQGTPRCQNVTEYKVQR